LTTTLRRPSPVRSNGHGTTPSGPPAGRSGRNRGRIALGLIVTALSVLGVVAITARGSERQRVIAVARDVPAGSIIEVDDLVAVEVPADLPVPTVSANEAGQTVGQTATVTLVRGTLVNRSHLSPEARIPTGMVLVGAVLDPGQYPVDVRGGDQVRLVETAPPTAAEPSARTLAVGQVREVAEPSTGASALVVSVLVPSDAGDAVAAAGAEGRISLVVVGSR
jgi:hypothetical protein